VRLGRPNRQGRPVRLPPYLAARLLDISKGQQHPVKGHQGKGPRFTDPQYPTSGALLDRCRAPSKPTDHPPRVRTRGQDPTRPRARCRDPRTTGSSLPNASVRARTEDLQRSEPCSSPPSWLRLINHPLAIPPSQVSGPIAPSQVTRSRWRARPLEPAGPGDRSALSSAPPSRVFGPMWCARAARTAAT